jgi:2-polyprenyl-3-methyl-5-hydroxy-6-metoxy-1,4-benzoquinol methylase
MGPYRKSRLKILFRNQERRLTEKLRYFIWATTHFPGADKSCPACGSATTELVRRKALVTSLYSCHDCSLMFRVPKDVPEQTRRFYQRDYRAGFTTILPDELELARLKQTEFQGTEKNYENYIRALQTMGCLPGQVILDFGASWGYGSWQLSQAGYRVYSYEVSEPRAAYAREKLGCQTLSALEQMPEKADLFFSAHVIEHLPRPYSLWEAAMQVLKPEGKVVLFMPNGNPARERRDGKSYHQLWGQVHPLLLTSEALMKMAAHFGFRGYSCTSPYDLSSFPALPQSRQDGNELLFWAVRDSAREQ